MIAPSVTEAPLGERGECACARAGRAGGAAMRSAGASGAEIHAAGAGAMLAPAEWMLNYSRPQGLSHS